MIVAHHFSVHGGFSFSADTITLNRLWTQFLFMGGSLGNDIFVLISGYFLVNSSGINYHKLFKLWLKIFFYSVVFYGVFVFAGLEVFSLKTMLKIMMPVTKNAIGLWFVSAYFVMYMIHPYINVMIKAMSREDCTKFVKALVIYWCIIPMLTKSSFGANNTINFICLYCIAAYIRLYAPDFRGRRHIGLGVLCILLNFLSVIVLDIVSVRIRMNSIYFIGMMRPVTIMACVCLLGGFSGLDIPHSKVVNLLASATFGVYMIHDNRFVRPFLWRTLFNNASFQDSSYLIPYSIAVILVVYISCTVIELIRAKIFRILSGGRLS